MTCCAVGAAQIRPSVDAVQRWSEEGCCWVEITDPPQENHPELELMWRNWQERAGMFTQPYFFGHCFKKSIL